MANTSSSKDGWVVFFPDRAELRLGLRGTDESGTSVPLSIDASLDEQYRVQVALEQCAQQLGLNLLGVYFAGYRCPCFACTRRRPCGQGIRGPGGGCPSGCRLPHGLVDTAPGRD